MASERERALKMANLAAVGMNSTQNSRANIMWKVFLNIQGGLIPLTASKPFAVLTRCVRHPRAQAPKRLSAFPSQFVSSNELSCDICTCYCRSRRVFEVFFSILRKGWGELKKNSIALNFQKKRSSLEESY